MSKAAASRLSPNKKTIDDVRQICVDEIWPGKDDQEDDILFFEIENVKTLKTIFTKYNRVSINKKKRGDTWKCIEHLLGKSDYEEKLFGTKGKKKTLKISRDALCKAAGKLRPECDLPKRTKRNRIDCVPKSHLASCNHGILMCNCLRRKTLIMALYDYLHPDNPFEWKSTKVSAGVVANNEKQKMKDVFSKLKTKYVLPSSKCTAACRNMQEKRHTKMYNEVPFKEIFSMKVSEEDSSSQQSSGDQSSGDASSGDESSDDESSGNESSDSGVAPNPFPNVTSAFKFRMKRILEIERDERKPPRSKTIQMNGNLFYIRQSNIEGAGLGLFAAELIEKGTKLLGNADTPSMRMRSFGKLMKFGNNENMFRSTPDVVRMNKKAENHYEKHVFEEESQEAINECWFNTAQQWGKDLSGQEGLSEDTKNRMTWIKPTKKTNFGKKQNHPYAIASRKLWRFNKKTQKHHIAVKYYDPFNTLWGFLNSSEDNDNVEFVKGKGDNNKSFFYKTELVTKRNIVAGEELLWYYGNAYWSPYKSASEDEFESEYDSQSGSYVSTDSEAEVEGLGDEQFYEGYVSSNEELDELQLLEKMYFGPYYVEQEDDMSDLPLSSDDSGSEAPHTEQDYPDKSIGDDKEPGSLQSEVPLHPDLKWGSNVLDDIQAYDTADADNSGEIDLQKEL